jgi:CDP-paratose synthetase
MTAILLTGATGFIGGHVARDLLREGYEVIALVRASSDVSDLEKLGEKFHLERLSEGFNLDVVFQKYSKIKAVLHVATEYGRGPLSLTALAASNLLFPIRLLETAANAKCPLFINTDTFYPPSRDLYALTKRQFLEWGTHHETARKISFVNARLHHVYGPGDGKSKFIPNVIRKCLAKAKEIELTPGEQIREFVYISDVSAALCMILKHALAFTATPQKFPLHFDVGSGQRLTLKEAVGQIKTFTESSTDLKWGALPYVEGEVMNPSSDLAPLEKLGWKPGWNWERGIKETIQWERQRH